MVGHISEHLIWAPDPRDDLAFTLYAAEREEINKTKDQIIFGLINGEYAPEATFFDFKEAMTDIFPIANHFDSKDWDDIRAVW